MRQPIQATAYQSPQEFIASVYGFWVPVALSVILLITGGILIFNSVSGVFVWDLYHSLNVAQVFLSASFLTLYVLAKSKISWKIWIYSAPLMGCSVNWVTLTLLAQNPSFNETVQLEYTFSLLLVIGLGTFLAHLGPYLLFAGITTLIGALSSELIRPDLTPDGYSYFIVMAFLLMLAGVWSKNRTLLRIYNTQVELESARLSTLQGMRDLALAEMAGGVAHEINNPLAILVGLNSKISKSLGEPEKIRAALKKSEAAVERISKAVKILQAISKKSCEASVTSQTSVDMLIDLGSALVKERALQSGVTLEFINQTASPVNVNPIEVSQAIHHLLLNAIEACERSKDSKKIVRIKASESRQGVHIEIEDNGVGVHPDLSDLIFQPFFTTKEVGQGVGAGLPLAKSIVESQGGVLRLKSNALPTCFEILLLTEK
ncbi:MAG: sensor histidine kinase [Pseudobdellovibrionaceae bacterium]